VEVRPCPAECGRTAPTRTLAKRPKSRRESHRLDQPVTGRVLCIAARHLEGRSRAGFADSSPSFPELDRQQRGIESSLRPPAGRAAPGRPVPTSIRPRVMRMRASAVLQNGSPASPCHPHGCARVALYLEQAVVLSDEGVLDMQWISPSQIERSRTTWSGTSGVGSSNCPCLTRFRGTKWNRSCRTGWRTTRKPPTTLSSSSFFPSCGPLKSPRFDGATLTSSATTSMSIARSFAATGRARPKRVRSAWCC
jgi:hypothetical protein